MSLVYSTLSGNFTILIVAAAILSAQAWHNSSSEAVSAEVSEVLSNKKKAPKKASDYNLYAFLFWPTTNLTLFYVV